MNDTKLAMAVRLKTTREKRDMRQNVVANKLGIHNSTLNKYESGERSPDIETVTKLAEIYNESLIYLLTGKKDTAYTGSTIQIADQVVDLSPEEARVFEEMRKHPDFAVMFHDLAKDPEKKVKTLIRMWKVIKEDLED